MEIFNLFSKLFSYPNGKYNDILERLLLEMKPYGSVLIHNMLPVTTHFRNLHLHELQEYYIRTFDVNASCYLDIGYVLFGEDSKRGQFLLKMNGEQIKANNNCGKEFSDHLPNVLTLLPKMKDSDFREELVVSLVLPALRHMIKNFKTGDNVYKILLECLTTILEDTFADSPFEAYIINSEETECSGAYSCGMDFTKLRNKKY